MNASIVPLRLKLAAALALGLATVVANVHAASAFPGAEGFGAAATGGRGGEV